MGVDRTDYLMYGADIGYDTVDYDRDEDVIERRPGAPFDLIFDGMGGKYAIAGKIVARSDPYDGIERTVITPDLLPSDSDALRAAIAKRFGIDAPKLELMLFTHFS